MKRGNIGDIRKIYMYTCKYRKDKLETKKIHFLQRVGRKEREKGKIGVGGRNREHFLIN